MIDGSICRVSRRGVRARRRLIGRQSREIAATQITPICIFAGLSDLERKTVQNGGSRATAGTSVRHGARLAFQSVGEPSAEYARLAESEFRLAQRCIFARSVRWSLGCAQAGPWPARNSQDPDDPTVGSGSLRQSWSPCATRRPASAGSGPAGRQSGRGGRRSCGWSARRVWPGSSSGAWADPQRISRLWCRLSRRRSKGRLVVAFCRALPIPLSAPAGDRARAEPAPRQTPSRPATRPVCLSC